MAAAPLKNDSSQPQPQRTVSGIRPAQQIGAKSKSGVPLADRPRVEIELNVFIDQPNPRWLLGRVRADALLARLPKGSSLVPAIPSGYRGFTIHIDSADGKRTVQVFHNTHLERWLLDTGRFCLTNGLAKYVEDQLT